MRTKRDDVKALITARQEIELGPNQTFYKTPKAWEIWDDNPLRRVKRIPSTRVFWVIQH